MRCLIQREHTILTFFLLAPSKVFYFQMLAHTDWAYLILTNLLPWSGHYVVLITFIN